MQYTTTTAISSGSSPRKNFAAKLGGVGSGIFALAATWILLASPGLAQQTPGGGGGAPTTLSDLGCGPAEIARTNSDEEWDCSADLTANERATAEAQVSADAAQASADHAERTADEAQFSADQAQLTADDALITARDASRRADEAQFTADHALDVGNNAQVTADGALDAANNAQATADTALALAEDAISYLRTIVVSPVGPTALDNGDELLAAVQEATNAIPAPSADNPILIVLEPGVYGVGTTQLSLEPYVGLRGAGEGLTLIQSDIEQGAAIIAKSSTLISDLSFEQQGQFEDGIRVTGTDVLLRRLSLSRENTTSTLHSGIRAGSGTSVTIQDMSASDLNFTIQVSGGVASLSRLVVEPRNIGIMVRGGATVKISDSELQSLTDSSGSGIFVVDPDSEVVVTNSQIGNLSSTQNGFAAVFGSRMRVVSTDSGSGPGFADIASSQIRVPTSGVNKTCVFSYDRSLIPVTDTCS